MNDAPFTPTLPTSASPGAITYSSSNTSVATIDPTSGLVTIVGSGSTVLTATQAETANYTATSGTVNMNVLIPPTLGNFSIPAKTIASEAFVPTPPTSDSGGTWSYESSNVNVATVNASTGAISIVGGGTTTITATQARTSTHDSATATATLTIESETLTQIDGGEYHTCAVTLDGAAKCWGYNNLGQLGDGTQSNRSLITAVSGLSSGVVDISAGHGHSCAVLSNGTVRCWGRNDWGNLGNGTNQRSLTPVTVTGIDNAVKVVALAHASCALLSTGGVKCWGHGGYGELGHGSTASSWTPVNVVGLASGVTKIAGFEIHMCAVTSAGGVKCWGHGEHGRLGDGGFVSRSSPADVLGIGAPVVDIALGVYSTCVITGSGGAKCWGHGGHAEQGNGSNATNGTAVDVTGLASGYVSIAGGESHYCATNFAGAVRCWGRNDFGQLGDGTGNWRNISVAPSGFADGVKSMTAGRYHTCALFRNGTVKCTGRNSESQLGDKTTSHRLSPVITAGAITSIHTLLDTEIGALAVPSALKINSAPFVVTAPTLSRAADITYTSSNPAVATIDQSTRTVTIVGRGSAMIMASVEATSTHSGARSSAMVNIAEHEISVVTTGLSHTCGITVAGGAKCWGYNDYGQLGNNTNARSYVLGDVVGLTSGVAEIEPGVWHTCAVTTAGGVKCWGRGDYGQLGENSTRTVYTPVDVSGLTSGVIDIASGYLHSCAVTAGGGVKCWGDNQNGQIGDGTTTRRHIPTDVIGLSSGAVAVAVSHHTSCALLASGGVKCWGYNDHGAVGDGTSTTRLSPRWVSGMSTGVAAISGGVYHFCAVTTLGAAKCWGLNDQGQIGDGSVSRRYAPADVTGLSSGISKISAGVNHSCALTTAGGVKCWGYNNEGQLGDNTRTRRLTSVDVTGLTSGVAHIASDHSNSTCAITVDNTVKCWGYNAWGQLGNASGVDRITPDNMYNADGRNRQDTSLASLALSGSSYSPISPAFTLTAPVSDRSGTITYFSSRTDVATVNPATGLVTIVASGRTVLSAVQGGTGTHRGAVSRVTMNVRSACSVGGLCEIGDTGPGGGKVFYDAGSTQQWGRYLEAATTNLSGSATWSAAVQAADALVSGGKSDWYLPSSTELGHLYTNRTSVSGLGSSVYWSATEIDSSDASAVSFVDGSTAPAVKTSTYAARAIRAFAPRSECELAVSCAVGDTGPGGGTVFYVDSNDDFVGFDYMEIAPSDTAGAWCDANNASTFVSLARDNTVGGGISNTQGILGTCDSGAASEARAYRGGGLSDWFLPTIAEMTQVKDNLGSQSLNMVGALTNAPYWTSYQSDTAGSAMTLNPVTGASAAVVETSSTTLFRPVRSFNSVVNPAITSSLSGFALPSSSYNYGSIAFNTTAPSSMSSGIVSYTSSNPAVATIHPYSGRVTIVAHGNTTFTATRDAWGPFAASSQTQNFTVNRGTPVLSGFALPGGPYRADDVNFTLVAPSTSITNGLSSSGAITYSSSNPSAATVNAVTGEVDLIAAGSTTFTATQAAQGSWNAATQTVALTVGSLCKDGGECRLGDEGPGGGTIFYVDSSNTYNNLDFMEIAPADASSSTTWCPANVASVTTGVGVGTGVANSAAMLAASASCGAAAIADTYSTTRESDWHLPSRGDLQLAVTNLATVNVALPAGRYWTSSGATVTSNNGSGTQSAFAEFVAGPTAQSSSNEWQYFEIPTGRTSATQLSDWDDGNEVIAGNVQWDNNLTNGKYPFVQKVTDVSRASSGSVLTGSDLVIHPDNSSAGVAVAWQNTLGYGVSVNVAAALKLAYPGNNVDGISYHVQRGLVNDSTYSLIGSGTIAAGDTTTTTVTGTSIVVAPGESIYVVVGNNGNYFWDHTILDFTVVPSARGAHVVDQTGSAAVAGIQEQAKTRAIRTWQRRASCQEIKMSTGANTNGIYDITMTINGVATPTPVYCLMDSAMDGGGWTLVMKAAQGSTAFNYFANYWTTANTLNPTDISVASGDAKYSTFNHLSATSLLAVFPDINTSSFGSTERGSVDGHNYGWTWKQTVPNGPKTPLAIFQGPEEQFIQDADTFSGFHPNIWTRQTDIRFYGFNWNDNRRARWGFGWNENGGGLWPNGARGSDDASGGIGLLDNNWSAGDLATCCATSVGLNRSMAVQVYVR
jgi:alpha-tubulin suppressor-like RCC1 family protein